MALRSGKWWLRIYEDGRQVNRLLGPKDEVLHSKTCAAVRRLADEALLKANSGGQQPHGRTSVKDFFDQEFMAFVDKNRRPSTAHSYRQIWEARLKRHFAAARLDDYRPEQATRYLTGLSESGLGRNAVSHVRSLMSSVFGFAVATGRCKANPVRDARILAKPRPPAPARWYTLEEVRAADEKLRGDPRARAVFLLAAVLGLRPGEISALRWESCHKDTVDIFAAAWRGQVGPTKTDHSCQTIPLVEPCRNALNEWRRASSLDCIRESGWVFPGRNGRPLEVTQWASKVLRAKLGAGWKGLYAGRRGAASILTKLHGPASAAQLLRHRNMATTFASYIRASRTELEEGMRRLEKELG